MLNSIEWSNLEEREKRHLLITMFKVFNNNCPTYLQEYFHRTSEVHNYNLRGSNYDFQLPLSYRGANAWNQLSNQIREIREIGSRDGAVVRALASHQCGAGSIPRLGVICGLSLLVLFSAPRGFSPGTPVFPSPQKPTFDLICIDLI